MEIALLKPKNVYRLSSCKTHILVTCSDSKGFLHDMKILPDDFLKVSQYKIRVTSDGYADTSVGFVHRIITGSIKPNFYVDHINSNKLDNIKYNLRKVNKSQNAMNQRVQSRNKLSKYKGVSMNRAKTRFVSYIQVEGSRIHLGTFDHEIDAAKAYNSAAKQYFGEYALLNEIP